MYRALLISRIPVARRDGRCFTGSLWARDVNANATVLDGLRLVCPTQAADRPDLVALDPRIDVVPLEGLPQETLRRIVGEADVVEVPGTFGWKDSTPFRRVVAEARRQGRLSIVGVSSNRPRTTTLNAATSRLPRRLRAYLTATGIRLAQRYLVRRADAVRVVGEGLVPLVERDAKSLSAEVASWITEADIRQPRPSAETGPVRLTIASRLEPMKGVHVGIEAVAALRRSDRDVDLTIMGIGAEEAPLRAMIDDLGLSDHARFAGQLDYPGPFFEALTRTDYVLLTNLNVEQPRLIFDAISQGAIPVCPENIAYVPLGLDPRVFYTQGDASSLATTLARLVDLDESDRAALRRGLVEVARVRTLEAMHLKRRDWIAGLLENRG